MLNSKTYNDKKNTNKSKAVTIWTDYKFTMPQYMNAVNASINLVPPIFIMYILARIMLGEDFLYNTISIMAFAGAIFISVWNNKFIPMFLGNDSAMRYRPVSAHIPLMLMGICSWTPLFIVVMRLVDAIIKNNLHRFNNIIQTVCNVYLGTFNGKSFEKMDWIVIAVIGGGISLVYMFIAYVYCTSGGVYIGRMQRFYPETNSYNPPVSNVSSPYTSYETQGKYCDEGHPNHLVGDYAPKTTKPKTGNKYHNRTSSRKKTYQPTPVSSVEKSASSVVKKETNENIVNISPVKRKRRK